MNKPTNELYGSLQHIYDHFNQQLFNNNLPEVIFTTQRKKNVAGYFSQNRWLSNVGDKCHEISVNPQYVASSSLMELFQTIVHEQCHLSQYINGKPSRNGYHNKEFSKIMIEVGLMPSTTGRPGGAKTGQNMSDYPLHNGKFLKSCQSLIESGEFELKWADRFKNTIQDCDEDLPEWTTDMNVNTASILAGSATGMFEGDFVTPMEAQVVKKTSYQCPECKIKAFGGKSLKLLCMKCDKEMKRSN